MGVPIARRLADAGHELTVWNRSAAAMTPFLERGAGRLDRPAEAFDHCDVCVTMLADGEALEAVTLGEGGLLARAPPARTLRMRGAGGPV